MKKIIYFWGILALIFWGFIVFNNESGWPLSLWEETAKDEPSDTLRSDVGAEGALAKRADGPAAGVYVNKDYKIVWPGGGKEDFPFSGEFASEIRVNLEDAPKASPLTALLRGRYEIGKSERLFEDFKNLDTSRGLDASYMVQKQISEAVSYILEDIPIETYITAGGDEVLKIINTNLHPANISLKDIYWEFTYRGSSEDYIMK